MALRIKELLKERNIQIKDFAEMLNINRVTLSAQINGNPTFETLQKWASILNVNITELFEKEDLISKHAICPHCGKKIKIEKVE